MMKGSGSRVPRPGVIVLIGVTAALALVLLAIWSSPQDSWEQFLQTGVAIAVATVIAAIASSEINR